MLLFPFSQDKHLSCNQDLYVIACTVCSTPDMSLIFGGYCEKICFLTILIICLLVFGGCQVDGPRPSEPTTTEVTVPSVTEATVPVDLAYENNVMIVFNEPYGEVYAVANGVQTEYNGITYSFLKDIPENQRYNAVQAVENVIVAIENRLGAINGDYEIRVRKDDYLSRVEGSTLYISIKNVGTHDFVIGVAQMLLGTDTNYGLLYGLAADVAQELGDEVEDPMCTLSEALNLYDSAPIYLDLNYACFLDDYADAETLNKVKSLARGFYDYLMAEEKSDLYTDYSDAKYCTYLSEFLSANGKGSYDNSDLVETRFYSGGLEVRLVWETPYGVFYLRDDFAPKYLDDPFPEDMLNSGYANLRQIIVDFSAQAEYMERKIGRFELTDETAVVVFQNERYQTASGYYDPSSNEIHLFSVGSFMHEYGHYLLREMDVDGWRNEAVCHYFGLTPVSEQINYSWYADYIRTEALDVSNEQDAEEYVLVLAVKQHIGHDFDWLTAEDYAYLNSAYIVAWDMFDSLTDPNAGIVAKYVFTDYLVGLVGEEAAINALVYGTPEETLGKTWEELISDWEAYLNEEFAWAKEYGR